MRAWLLVAVFSAAPAKILATLDGTAVWIDRGESNRETLWVRDQAQTPVAIAPVELGAGKRTAKIVRNALAQPDLLDVQLSTSFSNGQRENQRTRHFLLQRSKAAAFTLACTVEGHAASAMESSGTETNATFTVEQKSPLIFAVTYETRAVRWGPKRGAPSEKIISRFELVDGGPCKELTPPRPATIY